MLRFRWFISGCALSTCWIQSMAIRAEDATSQLQGTGAVVGSGDATRTITVPHDERLTSEADLSAHSSESTSR